MISTERVAEPVPGWADRFSLADRVVVVTGASSGMGARFAQVVHDAGASVVLAGRRRDRLELVSRALPRSETVVCDVGVEADCERLLSLTIARFGRVDVLINNAGTVFTGPAEDEPSDEWDRVMSVNLRGAFQLSQHAARDMIRRATPGVIINISSIMGLVGLGNPPQTSYRASKAALINLTRELAVQWAGRGIRVNALCPGFFRTEMSDEVFNDSKGLEWLARRTPMKRGGEVEELDGAILFLASDASSFMTGSTLVIDGGWTAI